MSLWSPLWKWVHKLNLHEAPDGPVNFGGQKAINLADPTDAQDADTKGARDSAIASQPLNNHALPTADVNFGGKKAINLADPVNPQDAATRNFVISREIVSQMGISAAQSIPSGAWTKVNFNTSDVLKGSITNDTTNGRIVINVTGTYLLWGYVYFADSTSGNTRGARFVEGGTPREEYFTCKDGTGRARFNFLKIAVLSAGATIELQVYQDTGGALGVNVGTKIGAIKLADA
jgi:hypothetical protein